MRDFAKVSPTVWRSKKFRSLPDEKSKLLYLYLLTCPHGNSAACFDLDWDYVSIDLGWSKEAFRKAIDTLSIASLVAIDIEEKSLFIRNWFTFNAPTNPKHALGLMRELEKTSSRAVKAIAIQELGQSLADKGMLQPDTATTQKFDTLSKAYGKGIDTLSQETRPDRDRDQTETETETKGGASAPKYSDLELAMVRDEWNSMAGRKNLPQVQILTPKRKASLYQRLDEAGGINGLIAAIGKVAASSFLTGGGESGWRADFDFMLQQKSFTKLMEGSYDDRPKGTNGYKPTRAESFAILDAIVDEAERREAEGGNGGGQENPLGDAGLRSRAS